MRDIYDREALIDRVDGDIEFLQETIEILEEEQPQMIAYILHAIEAGDADALVSAAHTYKGMVSNFCAVGAADAATQLEAIGRAGSVNGASELASRLESEGERLLKALAELLEGLCS
jgi:two-component system sensor histidine kinase/response regulator